MGTIFQKNAITEPALFTPFDTTKKIEDLRPMELCLFIKLITKIRILHFIYPE